MLKYRVGARRGADFIFCPDSPDKYQLWKGADLDGDRLDICPKGPDKYQLWKEQAGGEAKSND